MTKLVVVSSLGSNFTNFAIPEITGRPVLSSSATALEWGWGRGANAVTLTMSGTGFAPVLTGGKLTDMTAGTINTFSFQAPGQSASVVFSLMNFSAATFFDLCLAKNWTGLRNLVLGGNDDITGGIGTDTLLGLDGNDRIDGGTGNDALYGSFGADTLLGGDGADNLVGGDGRDTLIGGFGADTLAGGNGVDRLTGNAGADRFVFNGAPKTSGQDTIADFQHGLDHIALKVGPFANIGGVGPLLDSHFRVGTAATTADHGVIYNSATGNIYSDADGVGGAAAVLFAHVTVGTVLTAADFLVF